MALIDDSLQSYYKPINPYVFNLEYVVNDSRCELLPTVAKINLSSQNCIIENVFGKRPITVNFVDNHIYDYREKDFS